MNNCMLEWRLTIRDHQWGCYDWAPAIDLLMLADAENDLAATPLDYQTLDYDVRSTYDSRPINAYDFNLCSGTLSGINSNIAWMVGWQVPLGYRAVVRRFDVQYDSDVGGPYGNSVIWPLQGLYPATVQPAPQLLAVSTPQFNMAVYTNNEVGFPVPNNIKSIGSGGSIDVFFIIEEGTWFGLAGSNANQLNGTANVNVYGQLIPVRNEQLPYVVGNPKVQQ